MLLATVAEIREDLGFDDMTDINEAIEAALHAADPVLQARLATPFSPITLTDTYYVDQPGYQSGRSVQTEFRLTRGFVQSVVSVARAETLEAFGSPSEISYTADVVKDLEKGVIRDFKTAYDRLFVKVTYTAGFAPADSNPKSYDLSVVPSWLQEAAKLRAKVFLAGSPSLEAAQVKIDVKTLSAQLEALMSQKVRYTPVALLPM